MSRDGERKKCLCKKGIKNNGELIFKKGNVYEVNKLPNWVRVYNEPEIGWTLHCNEKLFDIHFSIIYHGG